MNFMTALSEALTFANLLLIFAGIGLGILVGALPGLSGPMAIAIAVPLTFYMSPLSAVAFLISVNKGGTFGGSISAILLNTPGSPEAVATALDGHPLAKKGQPIRSLRTALYSSVGGDLFSDIVLILVAASLAGLALKLGPVEVGALVVVALSFIAELMGKSASKGLIAVGLGILVATVGTDPTYGVPRLTFGYVQMQGGFPLMAVGIGLLALSEIFWQLEQRFRNANVASETISISRDDGDRFTRADFKQIAPTIGRSAVIGTIVGALPGLGTSIAAFLGYSAAQKRSKTKEETPFGTGNIEGIAGAEAANSAVVGANLIPLLALGIPGNVAAALLVGAFVIHGIAPGPWMFEEHPVLIYGIFISMIVANFANLIIGGFFLRWFALVLQVPAYLIFPVIILLCITGAYLNEQSFFSITTMAVFGVLGYLMRKFDIPVVAFIIGFILGPMLEHSLSASISLLRGDVFNLTKYPIALAFYTLAVLILLRPVWRRGRA